MTDKLPTPSFTDRIFRKKAVDVSIPARELLSRPLVKPAADADGEKKPDILARYQKDLPVQEFTVARSAFTPGKEVIIKARGTPYGFVTGDVDYVPIGMAIWCGRSEMTQRIEDGNLPILVVAPTAIYAAHLLPDSEAMRKMLVRSRLVHIDGAYFRSRHEQVSTGRFSSMKIDDSLPVIFAAPSLLVMTELKRRVLAVNVGSRPVTVNFD